MQPHLDHLDPTLIDHLSPHLSTCPIRHPLWPTVSRGDQGNTVQGSLPHKCGQKSSCSAFNAVVAAFLQIFLNSHHSLYAYDVHPYYWSFLKDHLDRWNTYLGRVCHIGGGVPPQTTLHSFLTCETLKLEFPIIICPFSDQPTSSDQAQGLICDFGPLSLQ